MTHAYCKFSPTDFRNNCRKRYNRHLATDLFFFSVDVNTICNGNESFSFSDSVLTWRFKSFIGNELIDCEKISMYQSGEKEARDTCFSTFYLHHVQIKNNFRAQERASFPVSFVLLSRKFFFIAANTLSEKYFHSPRSCNDQALLQGWLCEPARRSKSCALIGLPGWVRMAVLPARDCPLCGSNKLIN